MTTDRLYSSLSQMGASVDRTGASDTRQLARRMTDEAREAREVRVSNLQFALAVAAILTMLVLFAWYLISG